MKRTWITLLALALAAAFGATALLQAAAANPKPKVELDVDHAVPRDVDDAVRQAIIRDYSSAWLAIGAALADNNVSPLNDNFIGFALDKLTQRVTDQQHAGLKTRLTDRGHKVDAIFYSLDGSAIELRDTVTIDTQVVDGNTVLHSDRAEIHYYVVMTGAEDRWKVRVLESAAE